MKVKCVGYKGMEYDFIIGKCYEVKNGKITNERGYTYESHDTNQEILKFLSKWYEFVEVKEKETIVIYRNGDETVALDKTTGKKAVAKCHPDDAYDFHTGAMLAFERLVKAPKEEVREVKRRAKAGEYVKIVEVAENTKDYKVGDVLKIVTVDECGDPYYKHMPSKFLYEREYVVLENYQPAEEKKEVFKPYLIFNGTHYGYIGEETLIKDAIGRELKIGDTVELYNERNKYNGEVPITKENGGKPFVMGIKWSCNADGTIKGGWKIIKKRSYTEIANGEKVDGIKYVKE